MWLRQKWADLFHADFEVLLYDLTSTYFEGEMEQNPKARRGYSRDGRPDCVQLVIALVVTPDGFPLAYEVLNGNTSDRATLRTFLNRVEQMYGQARRVWVMDRGIPSEAILKEMREAETPTYYLVGTPKGKINQHERKWLELPWQKVRDSVEVKLYGHEGELFVLAKSEGRQLKEIAIRRKRLVRLLRKMRTMRRSLPKRDQLLLRIGAAKKEAGRAFGFVKIRMPGKDDAVTRNLFLSGGQGQAQTSRAAGRSLPATIQSHRRRSRGVVDPLRTTDQYRSRVPFVEKRVGSATDLSPTRAPSGRACVDCIPGLPPSGHAEESNPDSRAGVDGRERVRKAVDHSDRRGVDPDSRRALAGAAPPHATGKGQASRAGPASTGTSLPTSTSHQSSPDPVCARAGQRRFVVETLQQSPLILNNVGLFMCPNCESQANGKEGFGWLRGRA